MNDETTRLINDEQAPKEQIYMPSPEPKKTTPKTKKGNTTAAAAGGFVAGGAVGAAATAAASTPSSELDPAENLEPKESEPESEVNENIITPEPDDVILANDEGIRYAHVDADNFNDAFAQARAQVGAGGVFEYNGNLYGTYTAEEWNSMSEEERADYQNRVFDRPSAPENSAYADNTIADNGVDATIEVAADAEMISNDPVENAINVIGIDAVEDNEGNVMNIALVENNSGDQALLIDVDNDGTMDVLVYDENGNGEVDENEIHDISDAGINLMDLQSQTDYAGDQLYADQDGMPDYYNDADSLMTV